MSSYIILSLIILSSSYAATVKDVCHLDSAVQERAFDYEAVRDQTCGLMSLYPNDAVQELGGEVLRSMQAYLAGEYGFDEETGAAIITPYIAALNTFSESLNEASQTEFRPAIQDDLGRKLQNLFENYSSAAQRDNDQNAYFNDLVEVIAATESGQKAIDCFNDTSDPRVSGSRISFIDDSEESADNFLATYYPKPDPENPGKYIKEIRMGTRAMTPDIALSIIAHEMHHACDTSSFIDGDIEHNHSYDLFENTNTAANLFILDKFPGEDGVSEAGVDALLALDTFINDPSPQTRQLVIDLAGEEITEHLDALDTSLDRFILTDRNIQQNLAISEINAYQYDVDFLKEIAVYSPATFCNNYGVSSFYGGTVSFGQGRSNIESELNNGQFIHSLIDTYGRIGNYNPENFYQMEEYEVSYELPTEDGGAETVTETVEDFVTDENGNYVLLPEFAQRVERRQ